MTRQTITKEEYATVVLMLFPMCSVFAIMLLGLCLIFLSIKASIGTTMFVTPLVFILGVANAYRHVEKPDTDGETEDVSP